MDGNEIIPYIEPIYRFCCKRLNNQYDAEDPASKIICYVLDEMKKYKTEFFDAWVSVLLIIFMQYLSIKEAK